MTDSPLALLKMKHQDRATQARSFQFQIHEKSPAYRGTLFMSGVSGLELGRQVMTERVEIAYKLVLKFGQFDRQSFRPRHSYPRQFVH